METFANPSMGNVVARQIMVDVNVMNAQTDFMVTQVAMVCHLTSILTVIFIVLIKVLV